MANGKIIIELSPGLVGGPEQIKIDMQDIPSGWIGATQILQEAIKASTLKAFEQIAQAVQADQPRIQVASGLPSPRLVR